MNSEFTLSQGSGQKLEFAVQRNGGTTEDIEYLSTGDNFRAVSLLRTGKAKLVEVSENGSEGVVIPSEPVVLIVDYDQTLDVMIAAGRYDWKNDDINAKRFPIEGKGKVEFEAFPFHFDKDISSEDAKKQIEQAGYEVGKIEHILSFGANYPEEQRKFPIVGLGSVGRVGGCRSVPGLSRRGSQRSLGLPWWVSGWRADYRFLGVRKKVSQTSVS